MPLAQTRPPVSNSGELTGNILLLFSEALVREALVASIQSEFPEVNVLSACRIQEAPDCALALVLAKFDTHDGTGEAERIGLEASHRFPSAPLVALVDRAEASLMRRCMRAGCRGVIPLDTSTRIATAALRLVAAGGTYLPFAPQGDEAPVRREPSCAGLTMREEEVLGALRRGLPNKRIAADLNLSENTVKVYVKQLMRKLGATNRTETALKAEAFLEAGAEPRAPRRASSGPRGAIVAC